MPVMYSSGGNVSWFRPSDVEFFIALHLIGSVEKLFSSLVAIFQIVASVHGCTIFPHAALGYFLPSLVEIT